MKVIKHGNTIKELTCSKCGCTFTVADTDTSYKLIHGEVLWQMTFTRQRYKPIPLWEPYFICPECGHECRDDVERGV